MSRAQSASRSVTNSTVAPSGSGAARSRGSPSTTDDRARPWPSPGRSRPPGRPGGALGEGALGSVGQRDRDVGHRPTMRTGAGPPARCRITRRQDGPRSTRRPARSGRMTSTEADESSAATVGLDPRSRSAALRRSPSGVPMCVDSAGIGSGFLVAYAVDVRPGPTEVADLVHDLVDDLPQHQAVVGPVAVARRRRWACRTGSWARAGTGVGNLASGGWTSTVPMMPDRHDRARRCAAPRRAGPVWPGGGRRQRDRVPSG